LSSDNFNFLFIKTVAIAVWSAVMMMFFVIALPFICLRDIVYYLTRPKHPDPFHPAITAKLETDTHTLVEKLKPKALAKDDPLHPEKYTVVILDKVLDGCRPFSYPLVYALSWVCVALIEDERFLEVPVPAPTQDIVAQARYRDELRAVIEKHKNYIETKRVFETAIIESLKALPRSVWRVTLPSAWRT
jgi:hypothetical protein